MTIQFRNLVFEGGGVRGIAYIGAMKVMKQHGALDNISRVGGTSAGAINALLNALGYDLSEQTEILNGTNFAEFKDSSSWFISNIQRLRKKYGWYKGDYFQNWIGDLIERKLGKCNATFGDLRNKEKLPDLFVVGTNLTTRYAEVFSHEHHSDMLLAAAVRISMSIPLFFASVCYGSRKDVYVDGGVIRNYPVKLFDREKYIDEKEAYAARSVDYYDRENEIFLKAKPGRSPYVYNRQTLGLRLDTHEEIALFRYNEPPKGKPIQGFTDYAGALFGSVMQVQNNQHLHSDDWQRTIYIDTLDVGTTDFGLTEKEKGGLVDSGSKCAEKYFVFFEDAKESPINRIP